MKAIVYTSNTGFTERYAKLLGEETGLPVYTLEKAQKELKKGTAIIYMGWLFASAVKGYRRAADRFRVEALIGVGMCQTGTLLDEVHKVNDLPEGLRAFTVQGGMDHSKLKGLNKFVINILIRVMSAARNPSPEDQLKLQLIRDGGDYVSRENLTEFLGWYEEQKA